MRRGLAVETVRGYCNTARAFLGDRERVVGDLALGGLDVAVVNDYLLRRSRRGSISSSKAVVTGLRSLLRFLHVEGLIDRDLAVAVAPVANWRLASLVKALDAASVARLLDSCDQDIAVGRRDFAILLLLSRLGLRIGEVAALRLDDLDWRAGELVVCDKGSRRERLPLPVDVGEADGALWPPELAQLRGGEELVASDVADNPDVARWDGAWFASVAGAALDGGAVIAVRVGVRDRRRWVPQKATGASR